jgi:hypothetical protein
MFIVPSFSVQAPVCAWAGDRGTAFNGTAMEIAECFIALPVDSEPMMSATINILFMVSFFS